MKRRSCKQLLHWSSPGAPVSCVNIWHEGLIPVHTNTAVETDPESSPGVQDAPGCPRCARALITGSWRSRALERHKRVLLESRKWLLLVSTACESICCVARTIYCDEFSAKLVCVLKQRPDRLIDRDRLVNARSKDGSPCS